MSHDFRRHSKQLREAVNFVQNDIYIERERQTDRQTDGQTDGRTDRQTDRERERDRYLWPSGR